MNEPHPVEVLFTPEFKRNLRHLAKRYRNIRRDVGPVVERLAAGESPGKRITGTGHVVHKVRVPNSDARRGKSGGYRLIYHSEAEDRVVLVTIFSKSDQGDIPSSLLREIINEYESGQSDPA